MVVVVVVVVLLLLLVLRSCTFAAFFFNMLFVCLLCFLFSLVIFDGESNGLGDCRRDVVMVGSRVRLLWCGTGQAQRPTAGIGHGPRRAACNPQTMVDSLASIMNGCRVG